MDVSGRLMLRMFIAHCAQKDKEANATLIAERQRFIRRWTLTGVVQSDPFLRYSDSLYGKAIKAALAVLKESTGE